MIVLSKELEGMKMSVFDKRHGGAWDRGSADSYYGRPRLPHYYKGKSYYSERVDLVDMTLNEIEAYHTGYTENEEIGSKKNYG